MKQTVISLILLVTVLFGCVEIPNPGSIATDVRYVNRTQFAISGNPMVIGEFNLSTSTLPVSFNILEIKEANGGSIDALSETIPVMVYTEKIIGDETEEELALKSATIEMPALSIDEFTGQITVRKGNSIPVGVYSFDIEITNTSGSKVLEDAIIIEFKEYEVSSYASSMAKEPIIERVADSPNQILFVGYINDTPLHGNMIDFTEDRESGFEGIFVNDSQNGELWSVTFPVVPSTTTCNWKMIDEEGVITYDGASFDFTIGRPGSYVVRIYK